MSQSMEMGTYGHLEEEDTSSDHLGLHPSVKAKKPSYLMYGVACLSGTMCCILVLGVLSYSTNLRGQDTVCQRVELPPDLSPSGLYFHTKLNALLMVDDEGYLHQVDPLGTITRTWVVGTADLEGITVVDEASDTVYLIDEHTSLILEFDLLTSNVTRRWDASHIIKPTKHGIEGFAFVPNASAPGGVGNFFLGSQKDGLVYVVSLADPISPGASGKANLEWVLKQAQYDRDASGLAYSDKHPGTLFLVFDHFNVMMQLEITTGAQKASYNLPGDNQEGVAFGLVDGQEMVFVAEDQGELWMYEYPIPEECMAIREGEELDE